MRDCRSDAVCSSSLGPCWESEEVLNDRRTVFYLIVSESETGLISGTAIGSQWSVTR